MPTYIYGYDTKTNKVTKTTGPVDAPKGISVYAYDEKTNKVTETKK